MGRRLSIAFAAGALGALANVAFIWICGAAGVTAALGLSLPAPPLPGFLYRQVAWGGLWGLPLVLPVWTRWWWARGLILGALASAAALFYFFPLLTTPDGQGPGLMGLNFGPAMPIFVLAANSAWGLVAAWWYARHAT